MNSVFFVANNNWQLALAIGNIFTLTTFSNLAFAPRFARIEAANDKERDMAKCKIHEPAAFHAGIPEGGPRPAQATVLYVGAVHGDQIHERTLAGIRRCAVLRGWNVRCVEKGAATSGNVGETLRSNPASGKLPSARTSSRARQWLSWPRFICQTYGFAF